MRRHAALGVMLLVSAPSWAQTDGRYSGSLECGRLPFTNRSLDVPATVTVAGGSARFERVVLHPQTNAPVGTETGQGRVATNGQMTLRTTWRGRRDSITTTFSGRLTAAGGTFPGRQTVTYEGRAYPRSCTLTLRR